MKTFSNQVELTAHFEGFSAKAYKCPAGVLTIGYGETRPESKPVTEGMVCTKEQAMEWLNLSLSELDNWLSKSIPFYPLEQYLRIKDAMKDYAYNLGKKAFPSLLEKVKNRYIYSAGLEFLNGIYVAKKPLLGLLLRRISEYNTFTTGEYKAWEKGDPISQDLKDKLLAKNAKNQDAVDMINQLGVK